MCESVRDMFCVSVASICVCVCVSVFLFLFIYVFFCESGGFCACLCPPGCVGVRGSVFCVRWHVFLGFSGIYVVYVCTRMSVYVSMRFVFVCANLFYVLFVFKCVCLCLCALVYLSLFVH